jgi:DNA repair exonuclease SbcCD ATPase subunit
MLGDIHKHQYLDKRRRVAYSSSLIQQNHGEDIEDHGYILWDIENGKSEFKRVYNEYGYITIKIEDNKIVRLPEVLPTEVRLKIKYMNTTKSECNELLEEYSKGKVVTYISIEYVEEFASIDRNRVDIEKRENNVNKLEYQNNLIIEICEKELGLDKRMIKSVIELNMKFNKEIDTVDQDKGLQWTPLNLKFSNMFAYGEGNEIEFSKLRGIIGIIGPNHYGKSSILDIILFVLYDRCSRSTIRKDIMNTDKRSFYCELTILVNKTEYKIVRQAKTNQKNIKSLRVDVDLYEKKCKCDEKKCDEKKCNEFICKTGKDRNETNKLIYELVGTYNDFIMTYISLQKVINFTDLNQPDRVNYLIKLSGMDIFDKLHTAGKDEYKKKDQKYENMKSDGEKVTMVGLLEVKTNLLKKREEIDDIIFLQQAENNKIDTQIYDLCSSKCNIKIACTEIIDEKTINKYKIELERLCELKESVCKEQLKLEDNLNNSKKSCTDEIKKSVTTSYNIEKIKVVEEIESLKNTKMEKTKIRNEIDVVGDRKRLIEEMSLLEKLAKSKMNEKEDIKEIVIKSENIITKKYEELCSSIVDVDKKKSERDILLEEIERLKCVSVKYKNYEWDNNCCFCVDNPFTKSALESLKNMSDLEDRHEKLNFSVDRLNKNIINLRQYDKKYEKIQEDKRHNEEIKNRKDILTNDLKFLEKDIEMAKYELKRVEEEENVLNGNKKIITENEQIDIKISELENEAKVSDATNDYNNMLDILKECDKLEKSILNKKLNIFELDDKCKIIINILLDYDKNKENMLSIIKNREIDEKITNLKEMKKVLLDDIKFNSDISGNLNIRIHDNCVSIEKLILYKTELAHLAHIVESLKTYTEQIMNRGGIPFRLLDAKIENLENKTNKLLCDLQTDITIKIIKFYYSGRSGIEIYKDVKGKMLNILNCSGYEQFIVNLVLRLSIIHISNRWPTNFMAIDEGFSCMDNDNLNNISNLFGHLRSKFKFVLIVSHLDELKSNCDKYIDIVKPTSTTSLVKYI